jgi:hypothetical protein
MLRRTRSQHCVVSPLVGRQVCRAIIKVFVAGITQADVLPSAVVIRDGVVCFVKPSLCDRRVA